MRTARDVTEPVSPLHPPSTQKIKMAAVPAQVVMHPTVSQSLRLWSTTIGRDKTYRAVQYFARFLAWFHIARGCPGSAVKWNALKNHLAIGRKLMRVFKPLEHLQAATRATATPSPALEQYTTIGRQLGYAGYLTFDMLVWAHTIGFHKFDKDRALRNARVSMRFWLAGILFSLTHGLLKAGRLANEARTIRSASYLGEKDMGVGPDRQSRIVALDAARSAVRYQFLIDLFDVWLPTANLGLVNFNEGILGICGFITSLMALNTEWKKMNPK